MNEVVEKQRTRAAERLHQRRMDWVKALAVPIAIAFVGWQIQTTISAESVRKDYVQMALGILTSKDAKSDLPLRKWAVSVLKHSSPVPFDDEVETALARPSVISIPVVTYVPIPAELTTPCEIAKPKDNTWGAAVDVALERRYELESCNARLNAIRSIQGSAAQPHPK